MKTKACIVVAALVLAGCNNSQREQALKDLSEKDSAMAAEAHRKDSSILSYIRSLNDIQDNIDSIKHREKILSLKTENSSVSNNAVADIRSIDKLILKDNKEIALLEAKIKKMDVKDVNMEKMVAHLTSELAEKDSAMVALQFRLSAANVSIETISQQFNDSMASMNVERALNNSLVNDMNTVYYAVGTMKELKNYGVIDKKGGIIGIGRTTKLKDNLNTNYFTKADKTKLSSIPLYSKFNKVVTEQPGTAFKVEGSTKSDSLLITDANTFWSQSKYLVVVVK
jgi:hypothetical protein